MTRALLHELESLEQDELSSPTLSSIISILPKETCLFIVYLDDDSMIVVVDDKHISQMWGASEKR